LLPADGITDPLLSSLIALVCIRAGALIGIFVRNSLPKRHLDADTSDQLDELAANFAVLETTLAQYGPATYSARHLPNV
jgi:hypothetical protein